MATAYYTCNLVPAGLIAQTGHSPRWLGGYLQDSGASARRDALSIHPMTCPFVTKLVAAAETRFAGGSEDDCLVVAGGCDAMRRLGDLLAATYPGRVIVLSMPRSATDGTVRELAQELQRLHRWLDDRVASRSHTGEPQNDGNTAEPPKVDYRDPPTPGGSFVVAGPLSDDSLLRMITQLGVGIAGLESCTSPDRWRPLGADALVPPAGGHDDVSVFEALAAQVLQIGMCPRRSTAERAAHLARRLDESQPSSVIYARQSFCDPGAYDALAVARLAEERGLPYLEIEVGFPFEASGPLRTRVEAFLEAQLLDDDLLDGGLFDDDDDLSDGDGSALDDDLFPVED